jgi:hypothetical protein
LSDGLKQTEFNNGENQDFERIKSSRTREWNVSNRKKVKFGY